MGSPMFLGQFLVLVLVLVLVSSLGNSFCLVTSILFEHTLRLLQSPRIVLLHSSSRGGKPLMFGIWLRRSVVNR